MDNAIEFSNLTKRLGSKNVVSDASLSVPQGSVFGFLGPNGAGKTTTIRMLLGLIFADKGSMTILNGVVPKQLPKLLPRIGAMIEGPGFIPYLSGEENIRRLLSAARVKGSSQKGVAQSALEAVGLGHAASMKAGAYSMGMKQRLSLAWAICLPRELYILDEPTNGLDPAGMKEVRELITSLSGNGATVFISSHLLGEVEQICTHIALMSQGSILRSDSVEGFRANGTDTLVVEVSEASLASDILTESFPELKITPTSNSVLELSLNDVVVDSALVNRTLIGRGIDVYSLSRRRLSLEDIFLQYVGEGFDVH